MGKGEKRSKRKDCGLWRREEEKGRKEEGRRGEGGDGREVYGKWSIRAI
jgi:hypothetical protein